MSDEITTEVLAKVTNKTIETARAGKDNLKIDEVTYAVIGREGSDASNSLNAIAIAPIVNGLPDYKNVAVVFAGTNDAAMEGGTGRSGTGGAIRSLGDGYISKEYDDASAFLVKTLANVAANGGQVTDVSGFSQSGGYLMKIAAVYGPTYGFQSTSFDDFGRNQFKTLTDAEREWLKANPEMLLRYQNSSWAAYSFRDHEFGTVVPVSVNEHNTLAKYFDGDELSLTGLARDGHFAPGMTESQVLLAAKKWVENNPDGRWATSKNEEIAARIKAYLKWYGPYGSGKAPSGGAAGAKTVGLTTGFAANGAALIDVAIGHLHDARRANDAIPDKLQESYQRVLRETCEMFSGILDSYEVEEEAHRRGLQPEHHMDRAAISRVGTQMGNEIDELEQLKATLGRVSNQRVRDDVQLAGGFRF